MATEVQKHTANLESLEQAFAAGAVVLMEAQRVSDGETVALLCAATKEEDSVVFVPFAEMISGNPYELYRPPNPEGGFYEEPATKPRRKPPVHVDQHYYLNYIRDYGPTTIEELAAAFNVSVTTARHKLDGLAYQGKLTREWHSPWITTIYSLKEET